MDKFRDQYAPKRFCCYCNRLLVYPLPITKEHLIPISKGGNNRWKANLRDCCKPCNTERRSMPLTKFLEKNKFLLSIYERLDVERAEFYRIRINNIEKLITFVNENIDRLFKKNQCLINREFILI